MEHLCATLHTLLRKFINENFDSNVSKAARELDLNYYRSREVYNGTLKTLPFIDALRIFQVVGYDGDNLLSEIFPSEYATHSKSSRDGDQKDLQKLLSYIFSSGIRTELFSYICSGNGTLDHVQRYFGEFGTTTLDDMVKNQVLVVEENGSISSRIDDSFVTSGSMSRDFARRTLESLEPEHRGTVLNSTFGGVNLKGWQKGYSLTQDYHKNLGSLYTDPEFKGSIVVIGAVGYGPLPRVFNEDQIHDS